MHQLNRKMKNLKENTIIKAGEHLVSIGIQKHFVAIISPNTNKFIKLAKSKTNKRLRKAKREFAIWLNSNDTFTFERFDTDQTLRLIEILKGK